jgi:hypothetical protein
MNGLKRFVALLVCTAAIHAHGQTVNDSVVVHKDPRIDLLVNKQIEINEITTRNSRRSGPGFRILVISTNNRNKVTEAKTKIYERFPELKAYMMYQSPFFKLKVGNFKERSDAENYLSDIQKIFQTGVYIVPDVIEIKLD